MRKAVALLIISLFLFSSLAVFGSGGARAAENEQTQIVKVPFGDSNIVFGDRIGITNATYLGSVTIAGKEVAYYELQSGEHYVTTAPAQKALDWNTVKSLAQVKMENFDIAPGNNYQTVQFGNATEVFSSSDEIEGMEIVGNYAYITYNRAGNNVEMRNLNNFSLVKSITLGNSTENTHVGGIIYDGNGHLWTIWEPLENANTSYVSEFDLNLTEINRFTTGNDTYGTVFAVINDTIILGDYNCEHIAGFNITTGEQEWKVNTPAPFITTQDAAYLGNGYYLGGRYRLDENYSTIYLYKAVNSTSSGLKFITDLESYKTAGQNPIAVDSEGYVYGSTSINSPFNIYKTKDVFLPLIYANITSGDKYNIGFSETWPGSSSDNETYIICGKGSDLAVGGGTYQTSSIPSTTIISGTTTGIFKWAYYGTTTNINGNELSGYGLAGYADHPVKFGVQTWGSATQNLTGSVYLLKAVPYVIISPSENNNENNTQTYAVNIYTNITGATITINGQTYNNGDTVNLANGTYTVTANAPSGYKFDHWSGTLIPSGNVNLGSTITITINGQGGTIEAYFIPDTDTNGNSANGTSANGASGGAGMLNLTVFNNLKQFLIQHALTILFGIVAVAALFNGKFKVFFFAIILALASYYFLDTYAMHYITGLLGG